MSSAKPKAVDASRRKLLIWGLSCVAVALVAGAMWVGTRAILAKQEFEAIAPLASRLQTQIVEGEIGAAERTAEALSGRADRARSLTGDPVWRIAETIPWVGPNLTAVRQIGEVFDALSDDTIGPLVELAGSVEVGDFRPTGGVLDVQPLINAEPLVASADEGLTAAQLSVASIDVEATVEQVRSAKDKVADQLDKIAAPIASLHTATLLLPDMLGASGPRTYLLLFQNPAELRASGGNPGALALISVEAGRISLTRQASTADFQKFAAPVLPLSKETLGLYGEITGTFIQNVNLTPQFPVTASLAREMWAQRFGDEVDGVLTIDPVALGYLLEATGPVDLPTGDVLAAENAVGLLLRDAYMRYKKPAEQDLFFASAASAVFEKVSAGNFEPVTLLSSLARAGDERRVNIWSAYEDEQAALADTTLSGVLPARSEERQPFGVYLNDATASKMDLYLDVQVADGQVVCRKDGRPNYAVAVTLTNTAPADASSTLPAYVTGAGGFGVAPGNIKTIVSVYGTPELQNLGVAGGAGPVPYLPATDSGFQVSQIAVELGPGESTTLEFGFLGDRPFTGEVVTAQTPVINLHETKKLALTCESPLW